MKQRRNKDTSNRQTLEVGRQWNEVVKIKNFKVLK